MLCGALTWWKFLFPSYSWEQNMNEKTNNNTFLNYDDRNDRRSIVNDSYNDNSLSLTGGTRYQQNPFRNNNPDIHIPPHKRSYYGSGATIKWYKKFVSLGMDPEEARIKAKNRKKIVPFDERLYKKEIDSKILEPTLETSKPVTVSIFARGGKRRINLNDSDLNELQEAIIDEIALGYKFKLKFEGIRLEPGILIVDCSNENTAYWLLLNAPKLIYWKGVPLHAIRGEKNDEKNNTISIFFPKSANQDPKRTLVLLAGQNQGLDIGEWKLRSCSDQGFGQVLSIIVDEKSINYIINKRKTLNYKFGDVTVSGLASFLNKKPKS